MRNKKKSKTRPKPSDPELVEASEHIWYEVTMLEAMCKGLMSGVTRSGPLHNAMLESFAIHFRALYDFIYLDESRSDSDVLAFHYFSDQERWINDRPDAPATLQTVRERVNKEIAHITLVRLDKAVAGQAWSIVKIAKELLDIFFTSFINKVPLRFLSEKWDSIREKRELGASSLTLDQRSQKETNFTTSFCDSDSSPFIEPGNSLLITPDEIPDDE